MSTNTDTNTIIDAYTPRNALEDGVWVCLHNQLGEDLAREAGFPIPVYITCGVWADLVAVPACAPWQDEKGRAWDLVWMLRHAILQPGNGEKSLITVELLATHRRSRSPNPTLHRVWAEVIDDPDMGAFMLLMWPNER